MTRKLPVCPTWTNGLGAVKLAILKWNTMPNSLNESLLKPGELRVRLPLPPTLNHSYGTFSTKTGRSYIYKRNTAKAWQQEATFIIRGARKQKPLIETPVSVKVTLYLIRNRDIDSSHKLLLDTLEFAQVIKNDKQIFHLETDKIYPAKEDGLEVEVRYVGTGTTDTKSTS
jgi:Holliday junction resolvase RusA-like endonuclease